MAANLAQASVLSLPAAQDAQALKRVFATLNAESCPRFFNFHLHTVCSDGRLHPDQVLEQAIAIGLKGLAITDHHSVEGYRMAQRWLDEHLADTPLPHLWTGVEVTSRLLDIEVHILGYAFDPNSEAMQPYLQGSTPTYDFAAASQVVESIHRAGGIAILAHPVRYRRSPEELIAAANYLGIDGVETYYAYNNPNPWVPSPEQTQRVHHLSQVYGLLGTCGTDTHGANILQRL